MNTDKDIIDIDDTPEEDDRPQEVPQFNLEERVDRRDEVNRIPITSLPKKRNSVLIGTLITAVIALILLLASVLLYHHVYPTDYTLKASVSDNENIEYLDNPPGHFRSGTIVTSDSVLGVAFDMYSLAGLRASLET